MCNEMSELDELIETVETHQVDDHIGHHGWGRVSKKLVKYLKKIIETSNHRKELLKELKYLTDVYYSYSPVSLEREEEILEEVEKELKNES